MASSSLILRLITVVSVFVISSNADPGEMLEGRHFSRLRIIHKFSQQSPHWKPEYRDRSRLLEKLIAMDRERIQSFARILQEKKKKNSSEAPAPVTKSNASIRDGDSQDAAALYSRLVSGSSIGSGQYFAELRIGTPPRKFPLIVDTGSDLTWIQCNPAGNSSSTPWYDRSSSSSYKEIPCTAEECLFVPAPPGSRCAIKNPSACDYTYGYSDRSRTTGILAYETISMRSCKKSSSKARRTTIRIDNIALGCGTNNTGASFLGASGVLGLGQGRISFATQTRDTALGGIFSYCLVNYLAGSNASSTLVLGRMPGRKSGMRYTPIVRNPAAGSFYYVNVLGVALDGKVVDNNASDWKIDSDGNRGTIFDSGSTLSYFREPVYSKILGALNNSIQVPRVEEKLQGFDLCYNMSLVPEGYRMPTLAISFQGGGVMELPRNNYMVLVDEGVECVAFRPVLTSYGFSILGNLLQQDFRMEFDQRKGKVGFRWLPCTVKHN